MNHQIEDERKLPFRTTLDLLIGKKISELKMMMDSVTDPLMNFYNENVIGENFLFSKDDPLGNIDLDLSIPSPNILDQETFTSMADNPEFEAELNNFLANFSSSSKDSSSSTCFSSSSSSASLNPSAIDILDDFPFSPAEDESNKLKKTICVQSAPSVTSTPKLPVIINTSKISNPHLPKVVQLTKGNVVYIQAPNNSNKSQTNFIQVANCLPTILINTPISNIPNTSNPGLTSLPIEEKKPSISVEDYPMDENEYADIDHLPLTPSTSSESPDDRTSASPDLDNSYSKSRFQRSHHFQLNKSSSSMLTNLEKLPSSGPLLLTDEELKLIKQEGYQIPSKLPLTKTEEKILKKIRRKIKNKISAQESRRKKKEYVDTLERQIAKYIDENGALKDRVSTMEKNQRSLMQELQSLRSMLGKGTPGTGKVLMVLCLFFAVLFGIWSPIVSKQSADDFVRSSSDGSSSSSSSSSNNGENSANLRSSSNPSSNGNGNSQSLIDQQDLIKQEPTYSNYLPNGYKSRVLLSYDEHDNHYHGPYLPSAQKSKLNSLAPAYTYSNSLERYMNKRFKSSVNEKDDQSTDRCSQSSQRNTCSKRSLPAESSPSVILSSNDHNLKVLRSNHTSNYRINEKVVVIDQGNEKFETETTTFEGKPLKIIRVERTAPPMGNDTLKLSHRTVHQS